MTIEGLGKKFQEARRARNLTLDEAARMTKIRPARLAEIEADDFSQFPSLAYAKGFLLIYGKFLDVEVSGHVDIQKLSVDEQETLRVRQTWELRKVVRLNLCQPLRANFGHPRRFIEREISRVSCLLKFLTEPFYCHDANDG